MFDHFGPKENFDVDRSDLQRWIPVYRIRYGNVDADLWPCRQWIDDRHLNSVGANFRKIQFHRIILSLGNKLFVFKFEQIGESASPRVRGALGSFPAIFLSLGILIAYIIGSFVEYDVLAFILAGFPACLFVAMFFMPETPAWLLSQNREEEARKSLQFFRGRYLN